MGRKVKPIAMTTPDRLPLQHLTPNRPMETLLLPSEPTKVAANFMLTFLLLHSYGSAMGQHSAQQQRGGNYYNN